MSEILESVLNLVFPRQKETQTLEALTAQDLKARLPEAISTEENLVSLFDYRDKEVRQVVWEIKYRKNKQLAFMCAELLSEKLLDYLYEKREFNPHAKFILLPVPISKKRRKHRGYNQTELVTDYISKMLPPISYCKETLRRDIDKVSQTKKTKNERLENVKGCFSVLNPHHIRNNIVIIFDDVATTGATLTEICNQLSKHQPKEVLRVTIAC